MSNYYITVGANSYSFDAIFNERTGSGVTTTNFIDNNTDVGSKYTNIIPPTPGTTGDNPLIRHTSVNYNYNSIDISQYLLPKFIQYTVPNSYTESIPGWCTTIKAIIIGGGGGGGNFSGEDYADGGGGGGGAYRYISVPTVSSVTTFSVVVGSGGTAGGIKGVDSNIGYNSIPYIAKGGGGGGNANYDNNGGGGKGGEISTGEVGKNGGNGGDGKYGESYGSEEGNGGFDVTHQGINNSYGQGGKGGYYQTNDTESSKAGSNGYVRVYFIR